ncbi:dihydrodipicolinate synthase family protein, partial [Shewanella sp.]|uniref:dihydrodipicolinate synthase family protein n=1 Tax=Shewanella sp. TaxID=50422 RepID=UPI004047BB09
MSLSNQLKGIVPPVVTPYTPDNQIDFKSLRRVVRHLIDGGVHGLFMLGSTSECVLLGENERRAILDCALEEVNGRVPIVAGVMDTATDMCLRHARQAKTAGVQGLVVTAPYYTRTSQAETIDHFRFIKDEITLPLVAYDIPVCVGIK